MAGFTLNNLMVAFRTYVFGIFMAIGSLAILLYNGIMVGCFQFFFIERGLFIESALSIWLHGTLEISSIILAGGAGLTLGSGLLFPGTYSRLRAFQISAIRSLKLMLGITPIFVLAAIIESFLTRYTDVPDVLKLVLILLSASFIMGYFVVYPWWKSRRGFEVPLREMKLPPRINETVSYTRIKNNAEIVKDSFLFYTRHFNKLLPWILLVSVASTTAVFFLSPVEDIILETTWQEDLFAAMVFAMRTPTPEFILINTACLSLILYRVMQLLDGEFKKSPFSFDFKSFVQIVVISAIAYSAVYLGAWGIFFLICTFALLLIIAFTQLTLRAGLPYGTSQGWSFFFDNFRLCVELQIILLLMSFSFLLALSAPVIYIYTSALEWNFAETDVWSKNILHFIDILIKTLSFYLVLPLIAGSVSFLYFTLEEINSATYLKQSIARMGNSKNARR